MVTRAYYGEEEPSFRRFSSRGHSYPTIQDRSFARASMDSNHGSRGYHASSHNTRGSDHSAEPDPQQPRRRIQVACGRCRKRKIRCSGPSPDGGGSCSSCKSAGNDNCQFLRVSSTETPMKSELADLNYDPAGNRQLQLRMIPQFGNFTPTYHQQMSPLASEGWSGYRSNPLSTYPYSVRNHHHGLPSYQAEFTDVDSPGVDYSIHNANYQLQNQEYIGVPSYNVSSGTRGWVPAPQSKNSLMYPEQSSPVNYAHEQLPYPGNGYTLRPTISPEGKNYSVNNMSSNLPGPSQIPGNDRLLPYPAINRPTQQNGSFLRSSDILPSSQPAYQNYSGVTANVKPLHSNAISENSSAGTSYLSIVSSPESVSSSQLGYSSQNIAVNQSHNDMYASSNEGSLFQSQSMRNDSTSDLSYSYGPSSDNSSSKRDSHSSQSNTENSLPALANGHAYIPHNHTSYHIAPSSLDGRALPYRGSSGNIQTV